MDFIRRFLCKYLGKHTFTPYEPGTIIYEQIPGKSQPVKAQINVRECVCCAHQEPGPKSGVWQ